MLSAYVQSPRWKNKSGLRASKRPNDPVLGDVRDPFSESKQDPNPNVNDACEPAVGSVLHSPADVNRGATYPSDSVTSMSYAAVVAAVRPVMVDLAHPSPSTEPLVPNVDPDLMRTDCAPVLLTATVKPSDVGAPTTLYTMVGAVGAPDAIQDRTIVPSLTWWLRIGKSPRAARTT